MRSVQSSGIECTTKEILRSHQNFYPNWDKALIRETLGFYFIFIYQKMSLTRFSKSAVISRATVSVFQKLQVHTLLIKHPHQPYVVVWNLIWWTTSPLLCMMVSTYDSYNTTKHLQHPPEAKSAESRVYPRVCTFFAPFAFVLTLNDPYEFQSPLPGLRVIYIHCD